MSTLSPIQPLDMEKIFTVMEKFSSLIQGEEKIFKESSVTQVKDFIHEKNTLAQECMEIMGNLVREGALNTIPKSNLMVLRETLAKLRQQMESNRLMLQEQEKEKETIVNFFHKQEQSALKGAFYTRQGITKETRPSFLSEDV